MEGNEPGRLVDDRIYELIDLLNNYDASWFVCYQSEEITILKNDADREIHAPNLLSALQGAVALYGGSNI